MASETTQPRRLDRDLIVEAACALGDREGSAAITMRRLGAELGVDPTAVYRHFRNKDELLVAMADRMFATSIDSLELTPDDWRENLRRIVLSGIDIYRSHAAVAIALSRTPDDQPTLIRAAEVVIGELRRAGLGPREAARTNHALVEIIAGVGLFQTVAFELQEDDAVAQARRNYAALDPAVYPQISAVAQHLFPGEDEILAFLVELVLDAIELRAARGGGQEEEPA